MKSDDIIKKLEETGAILEGHFLLTSGKHSNKYIEKFRILENPETLDIVCREMAELFKDKGAEIVLSAAIGGILLCGGVGCHLGLSVLEGIEHSLRSLHIRSLGPPDYHCTGRIGDSGVPKREM